MDDDADERHRPPEFTLLPKTLLENGYPTPAWLCFIREYIPDSTVPLSSFIENVLPKGWWMPETGIKLRRVFKGKRKLELNTNGWAGNQLVVDAILTNRHLASFLVLSSWESGGYYHFEIPDLVMPSTRDILIAEVKKYNQENGVVSLDQKARHAAAWQECYYDFLCRRKSS